MPACLPARCPAFSQYRLERRLFEQICLPQRGKKHGQIIFAVFRLCRAYCFAPAINHACLRAAIGQIKFNQRVEQRTAAITNTRRDEFQIVQSDIFGIG